MEKGQRPGHLAFRGGFLVFKTKGVSLSTLQSAAQLVFIYTRKHWSDSFAIHGFYCLLLNYGVEDALFFLLFFGQGPRQCYDIRHFFLFGKWPESRHFLYSRRRPTCENAILNGTAKSPVSPILNDVTMWQALFVFFFRRLVKVYATTDKGKVGRWGMCPSVFYFYFRTCFEMAPNTRCLLDGTRSMISVSRPTVNGLKNDSSSSSLSSSSSSSFMEIFQHSYILCSEQDGHGLFRSNGMRCKSKRGGKRKTRTNR